MLCLARLKSGGESHRIAAKAVLLESAIIAHCRRLRQARPAAVPLFAVLSHAALKRLSGLSFGCRSFRGLVPTPRDTL